MTKNIKKSIIDDFKKVNEKFKKDYPNKEITRRYYRKYKDKSISEDSIYEFFGTFTDLKKIVIPEDETFSRNDIDVVKQNKKSNKRYFVSAIVAGAPINETFFKCIENYCKHNNAEIVLLVSRGVKISDTFSSEIFEKYSKYFYTEFIFNKNLVAMDFLLSPQQIIPLTGLNRFGGKEQSVIVASTKQMLNSIARKPDDFPHLVMSTGTISEPVYAKNRQGRLATQDNMIGGLIVEVESQTIFHTRQIQFDNKGFYDITDSVKYYTPTKIKNDTAEALIYEPHIGQESKQAVEFNKDLLKCVKALKVFIHDSFDGRSVNPHEVNNLNSKYQRVEHQKTLLQELNYFGSYLLEWEQEFKNVKFYHVHSNHNTFLTRYLESGEFVNDDFNARIGAELFINLLDNKKPLEEYVNKNFNIKRNIFLDSDESSILNNCEMNIHGHKGSNGSRGNSKNIEISHNDAFIGHSHSPMIFRNVFQIGCACDLVQGYNKEGSSSWMCTSGVLYKNGKKTLINLINDKWKI